MSIPNLPVNFKDDILAASNPKRKYQQTFNSDGSVSLEDVTVYTQQGSDFGASQVNQTNGAINNIYNERVLDLDELELVTEPGFFVDAQAVKEAHDSLNSNNIVESGHNDNGYWRKYGDGTLEMWNDTHIGSINITTPDNWNYYTGGKLNIQLPVKSLINVFPIATARGAAAPWVSIPDIGLGKELFQVWIYASSSSTNSDVWVSWRCFGTWK